MDQQKNKLPQTNNSKKDLLRYAGLSSQLLVAIGMSVFIGYKADQWLRTFPLMMSILPLLALIAIFYKLIRETSARRRNESGNRENDSV